jgi:hypothetical protein
MWTCEELSIKPLGFHVLNYQHSVNVPVNKAYAQISSWVASHQRDTKLHPLCYWP